MFYVKVDEFSSIFFRPFLKILSSGGHGVLEGGFGRLTLKYSRENEVLVVNSEYSGIQGIKMGTEKTYMMHCRQCNTGER